MHDLKECWTCKIGFKGTQTWDFEQTIQKEKKGQEAAIAGLEICRPVHKGDMWHTPTAMGSEEYCLGMAPSSPLVQGFVFYKAVNIFTQKYFTNNSMMLK